MTLVIDIVSWSRPLTVASDMTMLQGVTPFCDRLRELMAASAPPLTQAALATRTGLDASLISRLARGERSPTPEALQCIATVLGMGVDQLVRDTDAASRLATAVDPIRDKEYAALVEKLVEFEGDAREAKARLDKMCEAEKADRKSRLAAIEGRRTAEASLARAQAELQRLEALLAKRERELALTKERLAKAVAMFDSLRTKVRALEAELGAMGKSARAAALFGAIGAATGVATLSLLFGSDEELDDDEEDADEDDGDDDDE